MPWNQLALRGSNGTQIPIVAQLDFDHAMIHAGCAFTHSGLHEDVAASGGTIEHLIITGDNSIHLRQLVVESEGGPLILEYYENTTASANGTAEPVGNNNRNSSNATSVSVTLGPTLTADGDRMGSTVVPATSQHGGGVGTLAGGEWILKPNTKHLIRLINNDNQVNDVALTLFWYEPHLINAKP